MAAFSEMYDKEVSPTLAKMYWEGLKGYSDEIVFRAFDLALAKLKWFPRLSELREFADEISGRNPDHAWDQLMKTLRSFDTDVDIADSISREIVKAMGGCQHLGSVPLGELPFYERRFKDHYRSYLGNDQAIKRLTGASIRQGVKALMEGRLKKMPKPKRQKPAE
jgi:hypothetical protein